ncbi:MULTISPECIES: glycosyltransferase family A protein [Sphingobium]|nr:MULTISPECIES: glycosyltransferase family 2 protein [Sphingobium]WDA35582.1 glycosyltransferase family 2 protein [Sphingobium sp. YC-XJ3]
MRPDPSMARRRTTMPKRISVVIPFFQRKRGLLREAVRSVACQYLPWPAEVELIVVDDGSPVAADLDVDNLALPDWIRLRILRQANAGPAAARNHGLDALSPDSGYIAFLDSDDQWSTHHLAWGIDTLGTAHDFYFCDSAMPPTTMFAAMAFFQALPAQQGVELLDGTRGTYRFVGTSGGSSMVRDYLCQTSSVILRRSAVGSLRFEESLRYAGEDWLMWARIAHRARGICFSLSANSLRGEGINLYRDAHERLGGRNLRRILSMIRANELMGAIDGIDAQSLMLTQQRRRSFQMELAAILMHPRLYLGLMDRLQRAMIARAYRHLWRDLPGCWTEILRRKLRPAALREMPA